MNPKNTRNYYDMFAIMFNYQKSYQKYIENTHLSLLTETHEYYFGLLKHQIFIYSRWRHPPKTTSPRPYCRSRRGRNGLGSETTESQTLPCAGKLLYGIFTLYRICSLKQFIKTFNFNFILI